MNIQVCTHVSTLVNNCASTRVDTSVDMQVYTNVNAFATTRVSTPVNTLVNMHVYTCGGITNLALPFIQYI